MIDILNLYPRFFRVLAIAKVGGFNLTVYADTKEYENAQSDFMEVKKFCEPFFKDFEEYRNYDKVSVSVELENPLDYFKPIGKERMLTLLEKIEKAKRNKTCYDYEDSKNALIQTIIDKYKLSIRQIMDLVDVAFAIATLDGDEEVCSVHVLEASQYVHTIDGKKFDILL